MILNKFQHYTELHINLLSILYQLTSLSDPHSLILLAKSLDLAIFKDGFDMFRGRLRGAQRTVNHLHLAVLANISELSKYKEEEETVDAILALIAQDLNAFYRITKTYKKRLEDFRKKKKYDVEVHELMTRIGVNITKHSTHCKDLMDSYYFDDIIEYLIIIGVGEQNENDEENFKGLDFIAKIKEKKKKSNIDEIKKTTASIVDNSLKIIINIMSSPNEISDSFSTKVKPFIIV